MLSRDSEIDELGVDRIRNELQKLLLNENKINNHEICDILQKYAKDKFPNVTNEKINRKAL